MRIGCLCYATEQGVGYLAKSFYDAGVITDPIIFEHDSRVNHLEWYPNDTLVLSGRPSMHFNDERLDVKIRDLDVMLFFETPWDWPLLAYCRERKTRTVIVPMYEWWPDPVPAKPDKIICPSLLDADYFPGSPFVPIPVETKYWQPRTRARRFLHNAGGIGFREHKGTRELLMAMKYVESPLHLTVRAQDKNTLVQIMKETPAWSDDRVTLADDVPYDSLWNGHDVLIAPEKFNGLSLPLQEARAAGMLVMTTNRHPMNTWLPADPLIPVASRHRTRIAAHLNEIEECVVNPRDIAATMDAWYDRDINDYSLGGREWAHQHSWPALKNRWMREILC